LRLGQAQIGPIAGGGLFLFDNALLEQHRHGDFDAHVLAVSGKQFEWPLALED
jgi:hypothetical protein